MAGSSLDPVHRIAAESDAVRRFVAILRREEQALIDGDIAALEVVTPEKDASRIELGSFDADRPQDAAHARGGALANAWRELLDLAAEARELNRTNGILLRQRLTGTERALTVLNGAMRGGATYGPNGLPSPAQPGRSFLIG